LAGFDVQPFAAGFCRGGSRAAGLARPGDALADFSWFGGSRHCVGLGRIACIGRGGFLENLVPTSLRNRLSARPAADPGVIIQIAAQDHQITLIVAVQAPFFALWLPVFMLGDDAKRLPR
jgi:hypothetical protein